MTEAWVWTNNEDRFDSDEYPTREDARAAGVEESDPGQYVWTGRKTAASSLIHVDGYGTIERVCEAVAEECGEVADDWLRTEQEATKWRPARSGVSRAQVADLTKRLTSAFEAWLTEVGQVPTFYQVTEMDDGTLVPPGIPF